MNNSLIDKITNVREKIEETKEANTRLETKLEGIKEQFKKSGLSSPKDVQARIDKNDKRIDELEEAIKQSLEELEETYYE